MEWMVIMPCLLFFSVWTCLFDNWRQYINIIIMNILDFDRFLLLTYCSCLVPTHAYPSLLWMKRLCCCCCQLVIMRIILRVTKLRTWSSKNLMHVQNVMFISFWNLLYKIRFILYVGAIISRKVGVVAWYWHTVDPPVMVGHKKQEKEHAAYMIHHPKLNNLTYISCK